MTNVESKVQGLTSKVAYRSRPWTWDLGLWTLTVVVSFAGCVDRSHVQSLAGLPAAIQTAAAHGVNSKTLQSIVYEVPDPQGIVLLLGANNIMLDASFSEPLQREMTDISKSEKVPHLFYVKNGKLIWSGRLDERLQVAYSKATGPRVQFVLTPLPLARMRLSVESIGAVR
jgi:hypothetical protein